MGNIVDKTASKGGQTAANAGADAVAEGVYRSKEAVGDRYGKDPQDVTAGDMGHEGARAATRMAAGAATGVMAGLKDALVGEDEPPNTTRSAEQEQGASSCNIL
ncbi:hypothetical protein SeLEV6574_g01155 [Synchytrium endobioticum]|nr:hypothetical protein SeLEV6574_g01155 [Synchytrium endobioticum]